MLGLYPNGIIAVAGGLFGAMAGMWLAADSALPDGRTGFGCCNCSVDVIAQDGIIGGLPSVLDVDSAGTGSLDIGKGDVWLRLCIVLKEGCGVCEGVCIPGGETPRWGKEWPFPDGLLGTRSAGSSAGSSTGKSGVFGSAESSATKPTTPCRSGCAEGDAGSEWSGNGVEGGDTSPCPGLDVVEGNVFA